MMERDKRAGRDGALEARFQEAEKGRLKNPVIYGSRARIPPRLIQLGLTSPFPSPRSSLLLLYLRSPTTHVRPKPPSVLNIYAKGKACETEEEC